MEHGGTTTKGKSADTFGPTGPWLVTADEAGDPQAMALWTTVNGERRQDGNTGKMIFSVASLIAYVSRFMSLRAGDVISTGTPAGVGHGAKPPRYLQPGDVVEMGISGWAPSATRSSSRSSSTRVSRTGFEPVFGRGRVSPAVPQGSRPNTPQKPDATKTRRAKLREEPRLSGRRSRPIRGEACNKIGLVLQPGAGASTISRSPVTAFGSARGDRGGYTALPCKR